MLGILYDKKEKEEEEQEEKIIFAARKLLENVLLEKSRRIQTECYRYLLKYNPA